MRSAALLLGVGVLAAACGYRFTAPNAALPGALRAVRVVMLENRTSEPSAELPFTQALREQLERAGRLGGDAADGRVEGALVALSGGPFLTAPTLSRQPVFRLNAAVELVLLRGDEVVARASVAGAEEFTSGADVLLTEANRAAAIRRLADSLMREGLERLQGS